MAEISIISLVGGGFIGAVFTQVAGTFKSRKQTMTCHYMDDEVLSRIPIKSENNEVHENIYVKTYLLKNTTNIDIKSFKIIFQFDPSAKVIECYSEAKDGIDKQKIKANSKFPNQAESCVRLFNRGDKIKFVIKIANVNENSYYISESDCLGFKIKCKDKRKKANKSRSKQSNTLLIKR